MFLLHCCVLFLPLHLRWRGRVSSNLIIIDIQHLVIIGLGCCLCGVGIVIPLPTSWYSPCLRGRKLDAIVTDCPSESGGEEEL